MTDFKHYQPREHTSLVGWNGEHYYQTHIDEDGRIHVVSKDYFVNVAEKEEANHTAWSKIGFNSDVQTAEEIISPLGGSPVWAAGATEVTIESSDNTQDKTGGTGALSIILYYLTTAYVEKSVTVLLNGTTPVAVCSDFFRFLNMRVASVGTGGVPVGNLSLKSGATTYAYIRLGKTRARQCQWTVPAGKVLYITDFDSGVVHSAANKYSNVTLKATYDEKSDTVLTAGVHFMPFCEHLNGGVPYGKHFTVPKRFPARTDIVVTATSSGTASIETYLGGWVETA